MNVYPRAVLLLVLAGLILLGSGADDMTEVVHSTTTFGLDLYRALPDETATNVFLSPYSIATALTMTYAGAQGATADEMAAVLHLALPSERVHAAFEVLQTTLLDSTGERPYALHLANALWADEQLALRPAFQDRLARSYQATARTLDFRQKEAAARTINAWVAEQTRDKIRQIVSPALLPDEASYVLANAIYFKGSWQHPFEEEQTREDNFLLADGGTTPVPLMHQTQTFPYLERPGFQMLELPYGGGDLSMVVLLPRERDGLPALRDRLRADSLTAWMEALRPRRANVFLPRFTLEPSYTLNEPLQALGMTRAFDRRRADFAAMADLRPDERLSLDRVLHKAFVDVNEEGTEAAAVTGVVGLTTTSIRQPTLPVLFRADRPFLFLIRHRPTGSLLFLGHLAEPAD